MKYNFITTGIGSVPFLDVKDTCDFILQFFPDMPFWPQFVKRSICEDMIIQFTEGLSFLWVSEDTRSVLAANKKDLSEKLLNFYEHYLADDIGYFSISYDFAPGLYELVELVKNSNSMFIKGQSVGPITFAASIVDNDGVAIINNPDLLEACVKGIAIKGLWQTIKLKESGKIPILFFDEPYLSNIGSAFSTIPRDQVIELLKETITYIKKREHVIIGIHCCGNTDWSMIVDIKPDIISFDAFSYLDNLFLYKDNLINFFKNGGVLAWGVVPTTDPDFEVNADIDKLFLILKKGLNYIRNWGIDFKLISQSSILTPACGMGNMNPVNTKKAVEILSKLSKKIIHII